MVLPRYSGPVVRQLIVNKVLYEGLPFERYERARAGGTRGRLSADREPIASSF